MNLEVKGCRTQVNNDKKTRRVVEKEKLWCGMKDGTNTWGGLKKPL